MEEGEGLSYRVKTACAVSKKPISLWHDVTLVHVDPITNKPTPYLNFVCEIPKFSRKKFEIATDEVGNPIKQDEKKGVLREFKKGDIFFNYGCLPVSISFFMADMVNILYATI
jgi:inorganic pyrophosphatase